MCELRSVVSLDSANTHDENSFALVDFEEDCSISVVPVSSLFDCSDVSAGTVCSVKWKKTTYKATILAIGSKPEMDSKENEIMEEIVSDDNEESDGNMESKKPIRQTQLKPKNLKDSTLRKGKISKIGKENTVKNTEKKRKRKLVSSGSSAAKTRTPKRKLTADVKKTKPFVIEVGSPAPEDVDDPSTHCYFDGTISPLYKDSDDDNGDYYISDDEQHKYPEIMAAIMELKTKMIKIETHQLEIKGDVATLLHMNASSSPSPYPLSMVASRPSTSRFATPMPCMPASQRFPYAESSYEYGPYQEFAPLNSSFISSSSVQASPSTTPSQQDVQLPLEGDLITADMITEAKELSNSRSNFATNLVRKLFDKKIRAKSNIAGLCNKDQLDTTKMAAVRKVTLSVYPLEYGESELIAWKKCHVAIDESCRRLNKKKS